MLPLQYWDEADISKAPDGMYVCYINHDHIPNVADKKLMMIMGGRVGYRGSDLYYRDHVYGAFGPIPGMRLEENKTDE